jgi:hypothetical protein
MKTRRLHNLETSERKTSVEQISQAQSTDPLALMLQNAGLDNTFKSGSCRDAMPSRSDITFGTGPALPPTDVLEEAAKALINYNDIGLGYRAILTARS